MILLYDTIDTSEMLNKPALRHSYDGKNNLWIAGVGSLYTTFKEAEQKRDKPFEKPFTFVFFGRVWFANVAKYNYRKLVDQLS